MEHANSNAIFLTEVKLQCSPHEKQKAYSTKLPWLLVYITANAWYSRDCCSDYVQRSQGDHKLPAQFTSSGKESADLVMPHHRPACSALPNFKRGSMDTEACLVVIPSYQLVMNDLSSPGAGSKSK